MGKTMESTEHLTRKEAKKVAKRKKLEALIRITALNDQDRQAQKSNKDPNTHEKIHEKSKMIHERAKVTHLESKLTHEESKRTLEEECHSNSCDAAINFSDTLCYSNDEPSAKRLKPDPPNTAQDEEMPLHCDIPPTPPPAPMGSSKLHTVSPHRALPHQFPQVPQHVNSTAALLFQQNLASQLAKPFPHLINGVGPLQLVPGLLVPEIWNIPGTCLNPMAISVLPSVYSFGNPFLLPSPNIRIPVFSLLTPLSSEDPRLAATTNNIDEDLKNLRRSAKARSTPRAPRFILAAAGEKASLSTPKEERIPIFPTDLQRIILRASLRTTGHIEMRCGNFKSVSTVSGIKLLILEGLSLEDVQSCTDLSAVLEETFPVQMECIMPAAYEGALLEELAAVPLTVSDRKHLLKLYGSLEVGLRRSNQIFRVLRAFFPIKDRFGSNQSHSRLTDADKNTPKGEASSSKNEPKNTPNTCTIKFSRTDLLLSAWQMIEEGYPLPLKGNSFKEFAHFGMTKTEYKEVSSTSPMYGLDCEMCLTSIKKHELTRVSVINEKHEPIYDTLVMPPNPIINYLTEYSGVTKEMMEGVTTTLQDVQEKLREILEPDAILVGQSLNSDLVALQLMHPYVIDTSVIFNLSGYRCRKSKLKHLAKAFLHLDIQQDSAVGHDPTEDASSALKLVQLKLARSLEFGDAVLSQLRNCSFSIPEMEELNAVDETGGAVEDKNAKTNETGGAVEDKNAKTNETGGAVEDKNAKTNEVQPGDNGNIAVSVFRYLNRHTVNIVGNPDVIDEYHKYTYIINKWNNQNTKKCRLYRPHLVRGNDELDIVDKAVNCINQSFCTIAHVQLQQFMSELLRMGDEEVTQRFKALVSDFYGAAPEDSLVLVVLGGNSEGANGAVYLAIRRRKFTPLCNLPNRPTSN